MLLVVVALGAAVALLVAFSGGQRISGQAEPVHSGAAERAGWTTLINPASGLSYQIPQGTWRTEPTIGPVGTLSLDQGALRTPYSCGNQFYARGQLGSGGAAATDPATLANSVADQAASQFYASGTSQPQVRVGQVEQTSRRTPGGRTVSGVVVSAVATQHADSCLAAQGEVVVLVLRLADRDAVLVVNGDVSGGPAAPAPATDAELRAIVATAAPVAG